MKAQRSFGPIGADPEGFLVNDAGKFISSIGLIGGTKYAPRQMGGGFAIQEDNVAVEYNIPACEDLESWVKALKTGADMLREQAAKYGLKVVFTPSAVFDEDQLDNPAAREFGCEPDINAWTRKINPRPKAKDKRLRSTGGHAHITSKADPFLLGQWMDVYNGCPFVLVDPDMRRRELYGKAGSIRIKDYPGIEYRTLSSFWLSDERWMRLVYEQTKKAVDRAEAGDQITKKDGAVVRAAINKSQKEIVYLLDKKFGIGLEAFLQH